MNLESNLLLPTSKTKQLSDPFDIKREECTMECWNHMANWPRINFMRTFNEQSMSNRT